MVTPVTFLNSDGVLCDLNGGAILRDLSYADCCVSFAPHAWLDFSAIAKSGARSSRDLASLQPSKYSVPTSCTRSSCVALLFDKLMFIGRPDAPFRALQLLNLSQEVALIVLEVCQSLAHEFMVSLLVLNMST